MKNKLTDDVHLFHLKTHNQTSPTAYTRFHFMKTKIHNDNDTTIINM